MITLLMNPPFKKQARIYRKFARRFYQDIWILSSSDSLKEPLRATKIIPYKFDDAYGRTRVAYNQIGTEDSFVEFGQITPERIEFCKYKREVDKILRLEDWITDLVIVKLTNNYKSGCFGYRVIEDEKNFRKTIKLASCLRKNKEEKQAFFAVYSKLEWKRVQPYLDNLVKASKKDDRKVWTNTPFNGGNNKIKTDAFFTTPAKADELLSHIEIPSNNIVIDLCAGHGNLLDAAVRKGHSQDKCYGFDIVPEYVEVMKQKGYKASLQDILDKNFDIYEDIYHPVDGWVVFNKPVKWIEWTNQLGKTLIGEE